MTYATWIKALLLGLLCSGSVAAQVPPPPEVERFVDADPAARVFFPGTDARARARLARYLDRHPEDSRAWTARAFLHSVDGNAAAALADLERARGVIDRRPWREREVLWSEGWIRLNLGHIPEARAAWTEAVRMHGGQPYWAAYSFAVLAELGGERHTALAWYALAVRSMPERWGTVDGMLGYTRHWQEAERAAMYALFIAWQAQGNDANVAESVAAP